MATVVEFRVHEKEYVGFVNDPAGPIGRELYRRAKIVEEGARGLAPVRTGALKSSIFSTLPHLEGSARSIGESRLVVDIGSELKYALSVHEGTRAHTIRPKTKTVLKFRTHGAVVYTKAVHHPRTTGRKYLTIPLRLAAGA